jgi:DNA (cytosine-5)-methyltransferase 1
VSDTMLDSWAIQQAILDAVYDGPTSILPDYITGLTAFDQFCGAGGGSLGAEVAGVEMIGAANHWTKAVEVYGANHPNARVDCADVSQVDPRRYPATDILISGAECTNHSSAKGVSRKRQNPSLFEGPDPGAERSRATMWDVIRFAEHHRYKAILVENVIDVISWVLFPAWRQSLTDLGYDVHVVSLNSAHTGRVPQWRDRVYVIAVRRGITIDLELRPPCWCPTCEKIVEGRQRFKKWMAVAGLWRRQYNYHCADCRAIVVPPAPPAESIIDWSIPGQRIGDRPKPHAASTRRRMLIGLRAHGPTMYASAGQTWERPGSGYARAWPLTHPAPTQTCTAQHSLAWPPGFLVQSAHAGDDACRVRGLDVPHPTVCAADDRMTLVVPHRRHGVARPTSDPLMTVTAAGNHHGLLFAPQSGGTGRPVAHPVPTIATKAAPFLVTYTRTGQARPVNEPATTVTCVDRHGLLEPGGQLDARYSDLEAFLDDCYYRMLQPHESGRAQGFPDSYTVEGTKKDCQRLYGNANSPPAITLLVERIVEALGGTA